MRAGDCRQSWGRAAPGRVLPGPGPCPRHGGLLPAAAVEGNAEPQLESDQLSHAGSNSPNLRDGAELKSDPQALGIATTGRPPAGEPGQPLLGRPPFPARRAPAGPSSHQHPRAPCPGAQMPECDGATSLLGLVTRTEQESLVRGHSTAQAGPVLREGPPHWPWLWLTGVCLPTAGERHPAQLLQVWARRPRRSLLRH